MVQRFVFLAIVLVTALSAACSTAASGGDEEVAQTIAETAPNVRQADADFARDVIVEDDTLTIAKKGHAEAALALEPGMILVGENSSAKGSKNPMGFARRVKKVTAKGADYVIATEKVGLMDVYSRLKVRKVPLVPAQKSPRAEQKRRLSTQAAPNLEQPADDGTIEQPLMTDGFGVDGLSIGFDSPVLAYDGTSMNAKLALTEGYARIDLAGAVFDADGERGALHRATADIPFAFDAGMKVCGTVSVSQSKDVSIQGRELSKTLFDSRLGTFPVPAVPGLVVTARAKLTASCSIGTSAEATVAGRFRVTGQPKIHVAIDDGVLSGEVEPSIQKFGELDGKATISGSISCSVTGKIGFYFWDIVGMYASASPGATLEVKGNGASNNVQGDVATSCVTLTADIGTQVGVEAQLFGVKLTEKFLTPWSASVDILNTCTNADSCANRPPGWYCSELQPYMVFQCDGESETIGVGGIPCATDQFCKRSGPNRQDKAVMIEGNQPECVAHQEDANPAKDLACPNVTPEKSNTSECADRDDGEPCAIDPTTNGRRHCCAGQCVDFGVSACGQSCICQDGVDVGGNAVGPKSCHETVCGSDGKLWRCEGFQHEDYRGQSVGVSTSWVSTFAACTPECTCTGGKDRFGNDIEPRPCGEKTIGADGSMWLCNPGTKTWVPTTIE